MVTGGGFSAILSAGVWDFSLNSGRYGHWNETILDQLSVSLSRQLQQQQQQAELEGGGTRDGIYEAGPITLSQVRPRMCGDTWMSHLIEA